MNRSSNVEHPMDAASAVLNELNKHADGCFFIHKEQKGVYTFWQRTGKKNFKICTLSEDRLFDFTIGFLYGFCFGIGKITGKDF